MSRFLGIIILVLSAAGALADETVRFAPLTQEQLSPRAARLGRRDHGAAAQCAVHQPAVPRLHPQHRTGAEADAAVRLPALEHVAAGAVERDGDPDHRTRMELAVRMVGALPA